MASVVMGAQSSGDSGLLRQRMHERFGDTNQKTSLAAS